MANKLEQRARFEEWLGRQPTEYEYLTITVEQAGGNSGDDRYLSQSTSLAWNAWQAALQQAQQPAPDTMRELRAYARGLEDAQQPGAQAVAFGHVFRVHTENLSPDRPWTTTHGMPFDLGPAPFDGVRGNLQYLNLYTAPPPLPEGVSEEDVEVAIAAYGRSAGFGDSPRRMRAALESYRARLAAKGGGDRGG